METKIESLVSLADHEAGFKDVEVTTRTGIISTVRLTAPSRRKARGMQADIQREKDIWPLVKACLPPELNEQWLDRLTPSSADLVETVCFLLAFGAETQKKMEAAAHLWMTDLMKPEPKSESSAAAIPTTKSPPGHGRSSESASC